MHEWFSHRGKDGALINSRSIHSNAYLINELAQTAKRTMRKEMVFCECIDDLYRASIKDFPEFNFFSVFV